MSRPESKGNQGTTINQSKQKEQEKFSEKNKESSENDPN